MKYVKNNKYHKYNNDTTINAIKYSLFINSFLKIIDY